jgi:hypothetical protein
LMVMWAVPPFWSVPPEHVTTPLACAQLKPLAETNMHAARQPQCGLECQDVVACSTRRCRRVSRRSWRAKGGGEGMAVCSRPLAP